MAKQIIIDCDPGLDDAIALFMAFGATDAIEVLGITTVAGNVPSDLTERNARYICDMAGRPDIAVYRGGGRPLFNDLVTAEEYHGDGGLLGLDVPSLEATTPSIHAVDFIIGELRSREDSSITLVGIGPQTNIAMALMMAPDISTKIAEIVVMGGSVSEGGNVTPAAEFNFYVDPHAVDIVLNACRPVTIFPLDATHKALGTQDRLRPLAGLRTKAAGLATTVFEHFAKGYKTIYGFDAPPCHDALTIAHLIEPSLFDGPMANVAIETGDGLTRGATVVDIWGFSDRPKNARWINQVDADGLFEVLTTKIAKLA